MYLRDARHSDKFMYTLSDEQFYEPFEDHYQPSQEYVSLVTPLLPELADDWATTRDGFWFHVHPRKFALPLQGWKVHVSATIQNGASILKRAAKIALLNKVPFKFALDRNILSLISSKRWNRGGSGKFMTLYPSDLPSFKSLLEQLYAELRDEEGPYILSDKRYKDCRVLYYRYGGIKRNARADMLGKKVPVLITPEGEPVPDVRTPYFAPPPWAADPFPGEEPEQQEMTLNAGRYLVKQALAFSNSGGVYLADDRQTGGQVVIKEARAHTLMDGKGNDAIKLLKKEQEILELLRDTGIAPRPVESFYDWENFYLVEEYVKGVDVRELMLTQSPVTRVSPSLSDTRHFYEAFKKIFKSFAHAMAVLHEHGILFGDLSANNLKIDPATYAVRLIDFEGAVRLGVDEATPLYTPGFKDPLRARKNAVGLEDDLYGLAAIMFYMIFPIHSLSSLRGDLYGTVIKTVLDDIGWSQTEVFNVISGLSKGELPLADARELLDKPAHLTPPRYAAEVDADFCDQASKELGNFILASMRDGGKGALFPADPFMHQTNPLSLGFGACGVLYTLKKCGVEIPERAYGWLEQALDKYEGSDELPPGLLTGAAGIAWSLGELGLEERAARFMEMANRSPLLKRHHSYLYGMAGVGMTNLYLYAHTKRPEYLAAASELAESLLKAAKENDSGIYWEDDRLVHLGYGYGQSGVALFFLRLFQLSGKEKFLLEGRRALDFDLAHGVEAESGVLSFPRGPSDFTLDPYIEEGSAGIAKVALRYGMSDRIGMVWSDVHRKYSRYPGLLYGVGSFIDALTDAFLFTKDAKFLEMAKRPIAGLKDLYLIKQPAGLATPGDGLFRFSCDYATGVAGVMRALHRFAHLGEADFALDEVAPAAAGAARLASAGAYGAAFAVS
jgi:tRNA A-37 threonylcarbamoyl transferase component Bud32